MMATKIAFKILLDSLIYIENGARDCFIICILQSIKCCNSLYSKLKECRVIITKSLLSVEGLKDKEGWIEGFFDFFFADKWHDNKNSKTPLFDAARLNLHEIYCGLPQAQDFLFLLDPSDQTMDDPMLFLTWLL